MTKLSLELQRYFFEEERASEVKFSDLLSLAGERIFGFLLVILSLPSALPVPAPGYSTPFGILILLLAIQMIWGAKMPWLPEKVMEASLKLETVQKVIKAGLPWLERIERLTQPRIAYICTSLPGRLILGVAIALMALAMIIPLPGTNTLPAMGIFITAFGLQEDDGFISLVGLLFCVIAGFLSSSIIWATVWGSISLLDLMKTQLS